MTTQTQVPPDIWPELTYRYVEHYFWEPQHLFGPKNGSDSADGAGKLANYYTRIRSQEVPLNYLFNVFLRVMPAAFKRSCVAAFAVESDLDDLGDLQLCLPRDRPFVQPDVHLESDRARIFIECKVGAKTEIEQVQRYVMLHALLDSQGAAKSPYVLLLTRESIDRHWRPTDEARTIECQSFSAFISDRLRQSQLGARLAKHRTAQELAANYEAVLQRLSVGAATWQQLGDVIEDETCLRVEQGGEFGELVGLAAGDFLADLRRRALWIA